MLALQTEIQLPVINFEIDSHSHSLFSEVVNEVK